jgi:hypothetical protein
MKESGSPSCASQGEGPKIACPELDEARRMGLERARSQLAG